MCHARLVFCTCAMGLAFYLFRHAERDAAADALKDKGISAPTSEEIKDKVRVSTALYKGFLFPCSAVTGMDFGAV